MSEPQGIFCSKLAPSGNSESIKTAMSMFRELRKS